METALSRYRTEILIPEDRVLVLHLPEELPVGRAIVVVEPFETGSEPTDGWHEDDLSEVFDLERGDMEWWEEFEDYGG